VHFGIYDVVFPDPIQILMALHGRDLLHGRVIDLSDSGMEEEAFAVIEVEGIEQPVIVPVARLKGGGEALTLNE
jgi:hypothetical protein